MLLERDDVMGDLNDELELSFAEDYDGNDDDLDVGYDVDDSDGAYDNDDASALRTNLHDTSKRVNLAKVNASIHEVLTARPRASSNRAGYTLGRESRLDIGSPDSVESQVEAEIKEKRRAEDERRAQSEKNEKERPERERLELERQEQEQERQQEQPANHSNTPWMLYFDEENQHHYYFNTETEESLWQEEAPSEVINAVARKEGEGGAGDEADALGEGSAARPPSSPAPAQASPPPSPDFSSPTKLIRNFNESYNKHFSPLEQQQQQLVQLQGDPMVQVANTLQVIMTQFAHFTQNQAFQVRNGE